MLGADNPQLVFEAEHRAKDVGVENRSVAIGGLLAQRARQAFRPGIVHRDVEAPETSDRPVDEVAHILFLANISAHEFRLGADVAQLVGQGAASVVVSTGDDDLRAATSKGKGRSAPDAGQRASDQNDRDAIGLSFRAVDER